MEKSIYEFSLSFFIWQSISILTQIAIIILLYKIFKFLRKYLNERKN
jgi:hypothetical protein